MGAERMKQDLVVYFAQFVLALVLAPLLPGIINRVKAKFAGRHGKPVLLLEDRRRGRGVELDELPPALPDAFLDQFGYALA